MKLPKFYDGRSKEEKDRDAYYNGRFLLWAVFVCFCYVGMRYVQL